MSPFSMKLIALLYVMAVQLLTASAFTARSSVHNNNINYRHDDVVVVRSTSTAQFMAVATPAAPVKEKVKKVTNESDNESEKAKDRGWLVRLYNDPMNKREFVARCLMEVCGLDDGMAFSIMMKAHQFGISVIGNYHMEQAELYKVRLLEEGLLVDMIPADDEE